MNREGLIGNYDYAYLFTPRLPFTKRERKSTPFFGLDDRMPILLALILGKFCQQTILFF
jgi:NCS2 family nucleobase:cation symporter-2